MIAQARQIADWRLALVASGGLALAIAGGCGGERESMLSTSSDPPTTEEKLDDPLQRDGNSSGDSQPGAGTAEDSPDGQPLEATEERGASEKPAEPASKAPPADDRIVDKTFDDLKFDIEPGDPFTRDMLTEEIEALLGQRIRIRGFILPTFQRKGLTQFILVRDDQECCFGPGAALYDCIVVEMLPGRTADFSVKPVAVEGRLTLEELKGIDDVHLAIFHLDGELVE